jgi:hypothetical protein
MSEWGQCLILIDDSPTGRAYPDVAAQASNFQIVVGGNVIAVDGTSASSPVSNIRNIAMSIAYLLSSSLDGR